MEIRICLILALTSVYFANAKSIVSELTQLEGYFKEKSKCFGELGCVNITKDWYDPTYRPINFLPLDRDVVNTKFFLHTQSGPEDGQFVTADDPDTIKASNFDAAKPIVFITHGFIDDESTPWLKTMAKAILSYQGDQNVFIVGWGGGSLPPYTQAVANTRLVGLEIGFFGNTLINKFGVKAADMHIIGHSLGAHVVSYAADKIPELGMGTGLDPAGPMYHGMGRIVRLDYTDAKFVQAIHTDASPLYELGCGMRDSSGHVDFFPNNGQHQPGCGWDTIPLDAITKGIIPAIRTFVCSHLRSIDLFTDSLITGCPYVGYECTDYGTFLNGECYDCGEDNSKCAVMGMKAIDFASTGRKEVAMYLETGKEASFSKYHYHVKVSLADPSKAHKWLRGKLQLTLHGSYMTLSDYPLTPDKVKFYHGKSYNFLFISDMNAGDVQSVELEWHYERDLLDPVCLPIFCNSHLFVASVDVSILNYYPESNLKKYTSHLTSPDSSYVEIISGDSETLSVS